MPFAQDSCIFCRIAQGKEANKLLHEVMSLAWEELAAPYYVNHQYGYEADLSVQDDSLVAFRDINPAAQEHIQVISKAHIPSLFNLQATEADIQMGKAVLPFAVLAAMDPHIV